ncbi:MAG: hypothetical protein ACI3W7_09220 [Oscillospiraceae bacterium]
MKMIHVQSGKGGEGMDWHKLISIAIIWAVSLWGIVAMKKIEPDDWLYPIWALGVAAVFTAFVTRALWKNTL